MTQTFAVGDAIRISRDENIYAAKGTWSVHRSKPGFVVIVNEGGGRLVDPEPAGLTQEEKDALPRHHEYGVILTTTHPQWRKEPGRQHELSYDSDAVLWFQPWELVAR